MRYCTKCGEQVSDDAKFCAHCGYPTEGAMKTANNENTGNKTNDSGMETLRLLAFIFMLITTCAAAIFIIPLAWCIPMTYVYYKSYKYGTKLSLAFKICSLLFVSLVAGILMILDTETTI